MKSLKFLATVRFSMLFAIMSFLIFLLTSVVQVASDLYHFEVKSKDGKDMLMVLDEVERHDKISLIRVKITSGTSVGPAMFVVKGCYEIAKIRGEKYFSNLKEWTDEQGNTVYKIGYTSDKNNNPMIFFGDDIDKSKNLDYMSVEDCKMLFEVE